MNILICTPGRLIQHLESAYGSLGDNLRFLVIDEVDLMFEMGFVGQLRKIFDYFSQIEVSQGVLNRQILLFSATEKLNFQVVLKKLTDGKISRIVDMSVDVKKLAEMSQNDKLGEEMVFKGQVVDKIRSSIVRIEMPNKLPKNLQNVVLKTHENDKLDVLFSLIKSYSNNKFIVFLSTCRQVNFFYEVIKQIHPGTLILKLSGRLKQSQRQEIFFRFVKNSNAILLTTDISARGLDMTKVDFVVQYDISNDLNTFIHRAGRAGRMDNKGINIIMMSNYEEKIVEDIEKSGITLVNKNMKLSKACSVKSACQMIIAKDEYVKVCAEKAFGAWMKSVILSKFDVEKIDFKGVRKSWGLNENILEIQEDSCDEDFTVKNEKTALDESEKQNVIEILNNVNSKHMQQFEQENEHLINNVDQMTHLSMERTMKLKDRLNEADQADKKDYKDEWIRRATNGKKDVQEEVAEESFEGEEEELYEVECAGEI